MSTTLDHHRAGQPRAAASSPDPLCQHEFDDGDLCAADAVPGSTRCAGHQDDGQPDQLGGVW